MKPDLLKVLLHYEIDVQQHRISQLVRCPIHQEDRASCSVNLQKNLYSCKACGSQGDVYTLIQAREGIGFREAVEFGKECFGAGVPEGRARRVRRGGFRPRVRRAGLRD